MMEAYLRDTDVPRWEITLKLSRPNYSDFRTLMEKCSRVPSKSGIYQIGKVWIVVRKEGVSVCLLQKSTQRLPCRIKPEFYGTVYSRLVTILLSTHQERETSLLILKYLKGLVGVPEFPNKVQPDTESIQIRGLGRFPASYDETSSGQYRDTLSRTDSTSLLLV